MSGWLRRLRAVAVVALVFGLAWGTVLTLTVALTVLLRFGLSGIGQMESWLEVFGFSVGLGFTQGLLIAALIGLIGRDRDADTFPRWLGGLIGMAVGLGAAILIGLSESAGYPIQIDAITVAIVSLVGAAGGLTTAGLLTIARRGALPPAPAEPKKIGL